METRWDKVRRKVRTTIGDKLKQGSETRRDKEWRQDRTSWRQYGIGLETMWDRFGDKLGHNSEISWDKVRRQVGKNSGYKSRLGSETSLD